MLVRWLFPLLLLLGISAARAAPPPEARELLDLLRSQRAAAPLFSEPFDTNLAQWGLPRPLGVDGLVLDRTHGTVPGVRQIHVPGLLVRDAVISCEVRIAPDDQGYLVFRASDDADAAYQLLLTTRLDGRYVSGFVKKHNLDQLYGGMRVGESYRASFPPDQWLQVEVFFRDRTLLAAVDGDPIAFYGRADARDGSVSILAGAQPLSVRRLSVHLFEGGKAAAPYRPVRTATPNPPDAMVVETPSDDHPRFAGPAPLLSLPPRTERGTTTGILPGAGARVHTWTLDEEGRFFLDGEEMVPLRDSDGVYWALLPADVEARRAVLSIADTGLLERLPLRGLPFAPVRLRLVDYLNPVGTDHEFNEDVVLDGKSRLLNIAGRRCRVTSGRRWFSAFAYTLNTDTPLAPHLLVAEMPNDRERYPVLRIQPPDGTGGDPEYGVGAGTYAGRGIPTDGRLFNQTLLFYPRGRRVRFTVSRVPAEERADPNNGAALSQAFLFALVDAPADRPNALVPPSAPQRVLALSVPSARVLLRQFGANLQRADATPQQRASGYRAFLHRLSFLGFNAVDLGVVDVGPEGAVAEYPASRVFSQCVDRGALSQLLSLASQAGVRVTPVLPALALFPQLRLPGYQAETWLLTGRDEEICRVGLWPALNLLHPDATALTSALVQEVGSLCRAAPAVSEIGLQVDADLGGCIPRCGATPAWEAGFAWHDLKQFDSDTGIAVPEATGEEAYRWLRAHAWEAWTDWRCERLFSHWLQVRNVVRGIKPDWRLLLKTAVPDRDLSRADAWFEQRVPPLDLMRAHGFDPRLLMNVKGIVVERAMDVAYDRARAASHRENTAALDTYNYQVELSDLYRCGEESAAEIAVAPWAEHGQRLGSEFFPRKGSHWGTSVMTPAGRWLFRPATHLLRYANPYRLSVGSIEFAAAGREHDWRRFARAFRALPAVAPSPFDGTAWLADAPRNAGKPAPLPADLLVRRYGDRVGVIHDSPTPRRLELKPARRLQPGERWVDVATGLTLARATDPAETLVLDLDAFDLRVLAVLPDEPPSQTPKAGPLDKGPTPARKSR
ncbi:MAG: hypothetical protein QHJ73_02545 [Armatimonadota bacterium]|nr:hypothetical protein [Armatimonadota bacterium]